MARIADKHGLTNKYRQAGLGKRLVRRGRPKKYLFGSPKKRGKRIYNYSTNSTNTDNTPIGCIGCFTILVIFAIIVLIISTSSNYDNSVDNAQLTSKSNTSAEEKIDAIDLSAYEGECGVTGSIDLEKEFDSHLIETATRVKNNSGKEISKVTLYMVHCYGDDTPMESWEHTDRLNVENITVGSSKNTEWLLGTTTYGKKNLKHMWLMYYILTEQNGVKIK